MYKNKYIQVSQQCKNYFEGKLIIHSHYSFIIVQLKVEKILKLQLSTIEISVSAAFLTPLPSSS